MEVGTTENVAASVTGGQAPASSTGNVTSGTASEAMIKAATAASSAEGSSSEGQAGTEKLAEGMAAAAIKAGEVKPEAAAAAVEKAGFVPTERHEMAVKNARAAGKAEAEQQYAGFKGMPVEDAKVGLNLLGDIRRDPSAFVRQLAGELGLKLVEAPAATDEADEAYPAASLVSQDGAKAYSVEDMQKVLDIHGKMIAKQFEGRIKPLNDAYSKQQNSEKIAQVQADAKQLTDQTLAEARKNPHFKANEQLIADKLAAMDPALKRRVGGVGAMYMAFDQVMAEKVLPGIETAAEERVRANFQKKAHTSSGQAHPVDMGGDGKKPELKNQTDLAAHMERMAAAAAG